MFYERMVEEIIENDVFSAIKIIAEVKLSYSSAEGIFGGERDSMFSRDPVKETFKQLTKENEKLK